VSAAFHLYRRYFWPLLCGTALGLMLGCSGLLEFDDCQTDADCTRFGSGLKCQANRCEAPLIETYGDLLTYPCTHVYGVEPNEPYQASTYLLGVVLPFSGDLESYGPPIDRGVELAVTEINQAGGVFGDDIVVVSCDSATDSEVAAEAARHLIQQVGVSAVIGAAASTVTRDVFNEVAKDAGTLMVSPASTATVLTDLPDNGLLWRTAPSDAIQGAAIGSYVLAQEFERVAMIVRDDTYGNDLRDAILATLCAPESGFDCDPDNGRFFSRTYSEATEADDQSNALVSMSQSGFVPDVIVLISFVEDGIAFMNLADQAGHQRFVLTDGMRSNDLVGKVSDEVLCQVMGTSPASPAGEAYQSFALRYEGRFGEEPGTFAANAYDALFLLGYAIAGSDPSEPLSGAGLAAQLERLSAGEATPAGTNSWNARIQTLRNNQAATIDYQGASGKLDFDESTGEALSNIEAWAFDLQKGEVESLGVMYTEDGQYLPLQSTVGTDCAVSGASTQ